jgi:hypothetical protein
MRTFEQYLRDELVRDGYTIDYSVRIRMEGDDVVAYIHPAYKGGDTFDFAIIGNLVLPKWDSKRLKE